MFPALIGATFVPEESRVYMLHNGWGGYAAVVAYDVNLAPAP
jgi:hypothetical protein